MIKTLSTITILTVAIGLAAPAYSETQESAVIPAVISKDEIAGKIFERPDMVKATEDGVTTLDVTSFMSSDAKFGSGMWKTGGAQPKGCRLHERVV